VAMVRRDRGAGRTDEERDQVRSRPMETREGAGTASVVQSGYKTDKKPPHDTGNRRDAMRGVRAKGKTGSEGLAAATVAQGKGSVLQEAHKRRKRKGTSGIA